LRTNPGGDLSVKKLGLSGAAWIAVLRGVRVPHRVALGHWIISTSRQDILAPKPLGNQTGSMIIEKNEEVEKLKS